MPASLNIAIPTSRFVDPETGIIEQPWRIFIQLLWQRTGGAQGHDTGTVVTDLASETAARTAADQNLTNAVHVEAAARKSADDALVPVSQLGPLWAALNLSTLPVADPGGGRPWLKVGGVHVGP